MSDKQDKIAIITGNGAGLGAALNSRVAELGYAEPQLIRSADYDLCEKSACDKLIDEHIKKHGRIDLLINNLGNYCSGAFENIAQETWHEMMDTNLNAAFYLSQRALPHLRKSQGRIINIGFAGLEKLSPHPNVIAYTVAKTALLALTKGLAKAEAANKVMVNMLSPGHLENTIETESIEKIPVGRLASYDEAWDVIKLLASTEYITGQNIELSGGWAL